MNTSKQINLMVAIIFLSLIAIVAYTIWDPQRATDAAKFQEQRQADFGAAVFANSCRFCHGTKGQGLLGPPLNRPDLQGVDPKTGRVSEDLRKQAAALISNTITCGRIGAPMPSWAESQGGPLNDFQIQQLVTLIQTGDWDKVDELGRHLDEIQLSDGKKLTLQSPLSASDTRLPLPADAASIFNKDDFIRIGEGESEEQLKITSITGDTLTVQRGQNQTKAQSHPAGDGILKAPTPPNPPAITGATASICGQRPVGAAAPPAATPEAQQPTGSGPTQSMDIANFAFEHLTLTIKKGTTMVWTNKDGSPHTVVSEGSGPAIPKSPLLNQGQTYRFTFDQTGTFQYFCDLHPTIPAMHAKITVTE